MKINCIVLDDLPASVRLLKNYIEKTTGLAYAGGYSDPLLFTQDYLQGKLDVDILFLDIEMPGLSGMEVADILKTGNCHIIFTTSHAEYAVQAFRLQALDYLVKPVSYAEFLLSVERFKNRIPFVHAQPDFIMVKIDGRGIYRNVIVNDIYYFETELGGIRIYLELENFFVRETSEQFLERITDTHFIRIHRALVVSIHKIAAIEHDFIRLLNGTQLKIGKRRKKELLQDSKLFGKWAK